MTKCVDASLALTWLLPAQREEIADALQRKWDRDGVEVISAPLLHAEVTSVRREQIYFKRLPLEEGEEAFSAYPEIGVKSIDSPWIQEMAWELAKKFDLPRTYDMQYLAVAELNDCALWTNDRRFVN